MSVSAAAVAAVRSMSPELVGALVLEHATDRELCELLRRAIVGEVHGATAAAPAKVEAPVRTKSATKSAPKSGRRAQRGDTDALVITAVRDAGADGARVSAIAAALDRTPEAARYICARMVREGKLAATGATSTRRYRVAA